MPSGWYWNYTCAHHDILDDAGNPVVDDGGHPIEADDGGTCAAGFRVAGLPPTCDWKLDESENFCTAWFEQFVTHGHVQATCRLAGGAGTCAVKPQSAITQNCDLGLIRIDDDGGIACVLPCAP